MIQLLVIDIRWVSAGILKIIVSVSSTKDGDIIFQWISVAWSYEKSLTKPHQNRKYINLIITIK